MIIFYGERPHCLRKWCGFICKKVFNKRVKCVGSVKYMLISSFFCDIICTQQKSILNLQCNN